MGQPALSERRRALRKRIKGLPGSIRNDAGTVLSCVPDNVSCAGLGILSFEPLETGTLLQMDHGGSETVALEVIWCIREEVVPDELGDGTLQSIDKKIYRYGLKVAETGVDLISIFEKAHCIR